MKIEINSIITLNDIEKYIVLNSAIYENKKYYLAMGLDENENVITSKVEVLEEIVHENDIFVETVTNPKLLQILTQMFKEQMQ